MDRRRATRVVGTARPGTGAPSHLVLVPLPATAPPSPVAPAETDTAQPARLAPGAVGKTGDQRQGFCAKLRAARERSGILLTEIEAATKVSASHLAALERNDLSRWPSGIYRRAWIRGYATAVGLPADATIDEFLAAFEAPPQLDSGESVASDAATEPPLRLTLAATRAPVWSRVRGHAVDITVAVLLAVFITWATGSGSWVAIGVLALCAYAPIVGAVRRATRTTKV